MKRLIISAFAVLLFFNQHLQAQESYEDVVYLKNGSIFHGMIIEQVPGKSITIESVEKEIFTFTYEEIEKIRKEFRKTVPVSEPDSWYVAPPTVNTFQAGVLTGRPQLLTTVSLTHGVQVNDHLSFALGVGWDNYADAAMIPIFFDARSIVVDGQTSPFVFADAGYSAGKLKSRATWNAGGFVMDAGAGFIVHTSTAASFVLQVSYRLQMAKAVETGYAYAPYGYWIYPTSEDIRVNHEFVMITVGVGF